MKNLLYFFISICLFTGCAKDDAVKSAPKYIKILKVSLDKFPPTKSNGGGWDTNGTGPDLYFTINYNGVEKYNCVDEYRSDFSGSSTSWVLKDQFHLDYPLDKYTISLLDNDYPLGHDVMGGIEFTPYVEGNGYPSQIILSCASCNTKWTLTVEYVE